MGMNSWRKINFYMSYLPTAIMQLVNDEQKRWKKVWSSGSYYMPRSMPNTEPSTEPSGVTIKNSWIILVGKIKIYIHVFYCFCHLKDSNLIYLIINKWVYDTENVCIYNSTITMFYLHYSSAIPSFIVDRYFQ